MYVPVSGKGGLGVQFFIDTANVEEIRRACRMGFISGVTTNPSLVAKERKNLARLALRKRDALKKLVRKLKPRLVGKVLSVNLM